MPPQYGARLSISGGSGIQAGANQRFARAFNSAYQAPGASSTVLNASMFQPRGPQGRIPFSARLRRKVGGGAFGGAFTRTVGGSRQGATVGMTPQAALGASYQEQLNRANAMNEQRYKESLGELSAGGVGAEKALANQMGGLNASEAQALSLLNMSDANRRKNMQESLGNAFGAIRQSAVNRGLSESSIPAAQQIGAAGRYIRDTESNLGRAQADLLMGAAGQRIGIGSNLANIAMSTAAGRAGIKERRSDIPPDPAMYFAAQQGLGQSGYGAGPNIGQQLQAQGFGMPMSSLGQIGGHAAAWNAGQRMQNMGNQARGWGAQNQGIQRQDARIQQFQQFQQRAQIGNKQILDAQVRADHEEANRIREKMRRMGFPVWE